MDLRVLGSWGLTAQRSLQQRGIKLPIIFISRHARVTDTVAASRASALDMLEKPYDPQVLLERVSETLTLDAKQRNALAARAAMTARLQWLTPRESEVLLLVVTGKASKVITADRAYQ